MIEKAPNLSDRVLTLEGKVDTLGVDVQTIIRKVDEGNAVKNSDRRFAWQSIIGSAGAVGAVVIFVITSKVNEKTGPLEAFKAYSEATQKTLVDQVAEQQKMLITIVAQNATSITERTDLRKMSDSTATRVSELERVQAAAFAHYDASTVETEAQVSALEQVSNIRVAYQERLNLMMWPEAKGRFPDSPLPEFHISNRNPKGVAK